MRKKILHVFDVDGTLTYHDSLVLLLQYLRPNRMDRLALWIGLAPIATKAIFTFKPWILKQALLKKIWKAIEKEKIKTVCNSFFDKSLQADLRKNALVYIENLRKEDSEIQLILLSASCKEWLQPLANFLHAELICTELEYDANQLFTGQFATPNCKGEEKVRRLLQRYPAAQYEFICYADSPSDKPLQTISKQFFYRYF